MINDKISKDDCIVDRNKEYNTNINKYQCTNTLQKNERPIQLRSILKHDTQRSNMYSNNSNLNLNSIIQDENIEKDVMNWNGSYDSDSDIESTTNILTSRGISKEDYDIVSKVLSRINYPNGSKIQQRLSETVKIDDKDSHSEKDNYNSTIRNNTIVNNQEIISNNELSNKNNIEENKLTIRRDDFENIIERALEKQKTIFQKQMSLEMTNHEKKMTGKLIDIEKKANELEMSCSLCMEYLSKMDMKFTVFQNNLNINNQEKIHNKNRISQNRNFTDEDNPMDFKTVPQLINKTMEEEIRNIHQDIKNEKKNIEQMVQTYVRHTNITNENIQNELKELKNKQEIIQKSLESEHQTNIQALEALAFAFTTISNPK